MISLPEIEAIERRPDGLRLRFHVPGTLHFFAGHFPEVALLPGVVQIGWAVELARQHLAPARGLGAFQAMSAVKFMRVIQPGAHVCLQLALAEDCRELSFEFESDGHCCSTGRVHFQ